MQFTDKDQQIVNREILTNVSELISNAATIDGGHFVLGVEEYELHEYLSKEAVCGECNLCLLEERLVEARNELENLSSEEANIVTTLIEEMEEELEARDLALENGCIEDACECPDLNEPIEHWLIGQDLAEDLEELGEAVLNTSAGFVWGRCASGQSISADGVMQRVVALREREVQEMLDSNVERGYSNLKG